MKTRARTFAFMLLMSILGSCDAYKTRVVNQVQVDGSIMRSIIIHSSEPEFEAAACQVPVDSSWSFSEKVEAGEKDTSWIFTLEKTFVDTEAINAGYREIEHANEHLQRSARFQKSFRWFHTVYRFEEGVGGLLEIRDPGVENYLDREQLGHHLLPASVRDRLENGSDSLHYRALADSIEKHFEDYVFESIYIQWVENLRVLFKDQGAGSKEQLKLDELESRLLGVPRRWIFEEDLYEDSVLVSLMGPAFVDRFKAELDSATSMLEDQVDDYLGAENYDMEIRMPGRIMDTNGYLNSSEDEGICWTVSPDHFLVSDYVMWVESRIRNSWAWIVSAAFLLFVSISLLVYRRRRG